MIKMSELIKKQNDEIRKETGMVKEENLNEVDFSKIKLPSAIDRFLNKFVYSMKGANLNRMKRAAILFKVIDAAGMTPQQLMADIAKIKKGLKKELNANKSIQTHPVLRKFKAARHTTSHKELK